MNADAFRHLYGYHFSSIVLDEDVFREPVAMEQLRRGRPHGLGCVEQPGGLINVGPANAVDQGRVGSAPSTVAYTPRKIPRRPHHHLL